MCVRRLSLHWHSYIGFILAFTSSIHNKQQHKFCLYLSFSRFIINNNGTYSSLIPPFRVNPSTCYHKHGVLRLHVVEILVPRRLRKILHHLIHHGPDVLLDPLVHLPPTKLFVHWKRIWVNGRMKNTPPVHENSVNLLDHRFVHSLHDLGIVFVTTDFPIRSVVTRTFRKRGNGFYSGHVMLIVILHTLWQPFPSQLLFSKCWGKCDNRRKPVPTDMFFHKRHTQGKFPESVMSWIPCRVRFGEGSLQRTGILQFFYRSGKVCTRCTEHSSIPHLWYPGRPAQGLVGKEVLICKKSFLEDEVNYSVTRGLRTGWARKSESIRITLSDLDPHQVTRSPVSRPVFPSKIINNPKYVPLMISPLHRWVHRDRTGAHWDRPLEAPPQKHRSGTVSFVGPPWTPGRGFGTCGFDERFLWW